MGIPLRCKHVNKSHFNSLALEFSGKEPLMHCFTKPRVIYKRSHISKLHISLYRDVHSHLVASVARSGNYPTSPSTGAEDNGMAIHKLSKRKVATAGAGKFEDGGGLRMVVTTAGKLA